MLIGPNHPLMLFPSFPHMDPLPSNLLRHFLGGHAVHGAPRRVARVAEALRVAVAEMRRALHGKGPPGAGQDQTGNEHPMAMAATAAIGPTTLTRHG